MLYKNHTILKTEIRHANTGRPLYDIVGPYGKRAAVRPFLTTLFEAKQYLTEQIDAERIARLRQYVEEER